jgi:nascent polypeptide-associated complex subunit alpha
MMPPGMNPRKMNHMMKRMGISQKEIDAEEVIIRTPDHDIVLTNPNVVKVNMMGQDTFQITGAEEIRQRSDLSEDDSLEIDDDDIKTVSEQAGVSEDRAKKAIEDSNGDLAEAIMSLQQSDD